MQWLRRAMARREREWIPPNSTDVSEEMPSYWKIPAVGVRPPVPKQRRRFPDTIDLEPIEPTDPELDDSAVSIDCPTWMQENKNIGVRPHKPRWQVRMSQELFWKNIFAGDLTQEQINAVGERLQIPWDDEYAKHQIKKDSQSADKVVPEVHGAEARKRRSLTQRDRVLIASRAAHSKKCERELLESREAAQVGEFDRILKKFGSTGLTDLDMIAVKKDAKETLTLFL